LELARTSEGTWSTSMRQRSRSASAIRVQRDGSERAALGAAFSPFGSGVCSSSIRRRLADPSASAWLIFSTETMPPS
jgi:hypothetical protein